MMIDYGGGHGDECWSWMLMMVMNGSDIGWKWSMVMYDGDV